MDIERAKDLLCMLADGVNPLTGELLPASDSCNQVEIVRALHTVLLALDNKKDSKNHPQPQNAGKPWSEEDDKLLCQMFEEGYSRRELCKYFERTRGGIEARLVHLGKIEKRSNF